jgi:hypothetical protein
VSVFETLRSGFFKAFSNAPSPSGFSVVDMAMQMCEMITTSLRYDEPISHIFRDFVCELLHNGLWFYVEESRAVYSWSCSVFQRIANE